MNIFEFISHLRQEYEDKKTIVKITSILKARYREYKATGQLFPDSEESKFLKDPDPDFLRPLFQKDNERECYNRAYYIFERWQEIEDLKERLSVMENKFKLKEGEKDE